MPVSIMKTGKGDIDMKNYALQPNESILYSGNVYLGTGNTSVELALTKQLLTIIIIIIIQIITLKIIPQKK